MSRKVPLLSVEGLALSFSGVQALRGINLDVMQGELVAIIGPNGAGKTSLFNCISGAYRPHAGRIQFGGVSLLGLPPESVASQGVGRMFQNLLLFEHMTVLDNLMLGRHHRYHLPFWHDFFYTSKMRQAEIANRRKVEEIIEFLGLESVRKMPIGILPYGVLKRVELGRALAMEPRLLLMDEPAAGLNREETEDMARFVLDMKEVLGLTLVLIEHELRFVFDLADRVAVLDFGQKIADGPPDLIQADQRVLAAYTGVTSEDGEQVESLA